MTRYRKILCRVLLFKRRLNMEVNNEMNTATSSETLNETVKTAEETEAEKKKAFEKAEAKRKAEFDAKKAERDEEILIEWEINTMMTTEDLIEAAKNNIKTGVERITQRNMKESVAAYIIELSQNSENLSRNILHPQKSITNCYKYINRKAKGYLEEQMKLTGEKPDKNGIIGIDIPDNLCYQWAEEYYSSTNIDEDHEDEEKFVPKTYRPSYTPKAKKSTPKKKESPPPKEETKAEETAQMSIL